MGHPTYSRNAGDSVPTQLADDGWSAPRLSRALLEAVPGQYDCYKTKLEADLTSPSPAGKKVTLLTLATFDDELKTLLGHIQERLEKGVDEAWISKQAYAWEGDPSKVPAGASDDEKTAAKLESALDTTLFYNSQEERWARAFSEKFLFSMYAEPGDTYRDENRDTGLYDAFPSVYPIAVECQHLSTFAILTRGFAMADIQKFTNPKVGDPKPWVTGCSCSGGTVSFSAFDQTLSKTFNHDEDDAAKYVKVAELVKLPVSPGSIVVFNPGSKTETSQDLGETTHMGTMLRISGARIQFIDTGVLGGDGEPVAEGGTVDHEFTSDKVREWSSMVGVGVLKPASDLDSMINRLVASRPLGFVRLVIADTSGTALKLRFVSKLLHMKYPVTYLAWSLRGLQVVSDGLTALWFVYLTQGKFSSKEPDRDWTDALILDGTKKPTDLLEAGWGTLVLSHVLRGEPSGKVRIFRRKLTNTVDGYYEDLTTSRSPPKSPAALIQGEIADGTAKLGDWCMSYGNFGQRLVCKPDATVATADQGTSGASFFDPA